MLTAVAVGWNNLFEDFFAVFVMTGWYEPKTKGIFNKDILFKAKKMLKLKFDFDFNVKLVISRRIIYSNKDGIILLQSKSNDFLTGFDSTQSLSIFFAIIRTNDDQYSTTLQPVFSS